MIIQHAFACSYTFMIVIFYFFERLNVKDTNLIILLSYFLCQDGAFILKQKKFIYIFLIYEL